MFLETSLGSGIAPVVGVEPTYGWVVGGESLELPTFWV